MGVGLLLVVGFIGLSKAPIFTFFSALTVVAAVGLVTEGISTGECLLSSQEVVMGVRDVGIAIEGILSSQEVVAVVRDVGIVIGGISVISHIAGAASGWSGELVRGTLPSESVRLFSCCRTMGTSIIEATSMVGATGFDRTSEDDVGVGNA
jgi:hypothetical protein